MWGLFNAICGAERLHRGLETSVTFGFCIEQLEDGHWTTGPQSASYHHFSPHQATQPGLAFLWPDAVRMLKTVHMSYAELTTLLNYGVLLDRCHPKSEGDDTLH